MDYNKAALLLHTIDKAKNWPNLKGVHDAAMHELSLLNGEALQEKAKRDEEAKAKLAEEAEERAERIEAQARIEAKNIEDERVRNLKAADEAKARQRAEALTDSGPAKPLPFAEREAMNEPRPGSPVIERRAPDSNVGSGK